jgi:hypothetical protein
MCRQGNDSALKRARIGRKTEASHYRSHITCHTSHVTHHTSHGDLTLQWMLNLRLRGALVIIIRLHEV